MSESVSKRMTITAMSLGEKSFSEKYDIAVNAGAVAVIIANNNGENPDETFMMGQKKYDDRNTNCLHQLLR